MDDSWEISDVAEVTGDGDDLTRLVMCAEIGVGKRTLIARLLPEAAGLEAPATTTVTHKRLFTGRRGFVVADVPAAGDHRLAELVSAASSADGAVLILDAQTGVVPESRRLGHILSLLGVADLTLVVNKMDLVGNAEERFLQIADEYREFAGRVGIWRLTCIPTSVLNGDNVDALSTRMPWYDGPALLPHLQAIDGVRARSALIAAEPSGIADQFEAMIICTGTKPLLRGRSYTMRIGASTVTATVAPLKYRLDLDTGERVPATKLEVGEIGVGQLELSSAVGFDPFRENRANGSFALAELITGEPAATGLIHFALRRAKNLSWQHLTVTGESRALLLGQRPTVLWLTGLSGAGKSTLANEIAGALHRRGHLTFVLDGDNVRHGLNSDLGFTDADRAENIRRIAEVARLMADAGLIVIVSFISPFRAEREAARMLFEAGEFMEIYVDTPLEVAEQRDPKGLYRKARSGELINFTGIDSPYEPPAHPEMRIATISLAPDEAARLVIDTLEREGRLRPLDE